MDIFFTLFIWTDISEYVKKMEIFIIEKFLLQLIGVLRYENFKISFIHYGCLISPILLLFPSFAFFCANILDVGQATDSVYITFILALTISKHQRLIKRKATVEFILLELQRIVTSGKLGNFLVFFFLFLSHVSIF